VVEDPIDVTGSATIIIDEAGSVGHEPPGTQARTIDLLRLLDLHVRKLHLTPCSVFGRSE